MGFFKSLTEVFSQQPAISDESWVFRKSENPELKKKIKY